MPSKFNSQLYGSIPDTGANDHEWQEMKNEEN
jgi:hypothetical protein